MSKLKYHMKKSFIHRGSSIRSSVAFVGLFGFAFSVASPPLLASAPTVYVAQAAKGSDSGSSCSNAHSVSWFNNNGNWGGGGTQIGAGTTVHLCGTITSKLTFGGGGASGNPVVVDGTGATMKNAGFLVQKRDWWTIQNVTWADFSTAQPFDIQGGSNGVMDHNTARDIKAYCLVKFKQNGGLSTNMTMSDSYFSSAASNPSNTQKDMILTEGSINTIIEGNYLELKADGDSKAAHNDILQTYEKGGSSYGPPRGLTVRYNYFVMNSTEPHNKSWVMSERLAGKNYFYGNVFVGINGADSANGFNVTRHKDSGTEVHVYNNTFVSKNSASNNMVVLGYPGRTIFKNNIVIAESGQGMLTVREPERGLVTRDHNLWYGSRAPSCSGHAGSICGVDPKFTNYGANDFSLQSDSAGIHAGANLGSAYGVFVSPGSSWPNPKLVVPSVSSLWPMGALGPSDGDGSVTTPPSPPENIRATQ